MCTLRSARMTSHPAGSPRQPVGLDGQGAGAGPARARPPCLLPGGAGTGRRPRGRRSRARTRRPARAVPGPAGGPGWSCRRSTGPSSATMYGSPVMRAGPRSVFPAPDPPPSSRDRTPGRRPPRAPRSASGKAATRASRTPGGPGAPSHASVSTTCTAQTCRVAAAVDPHGRRPGRDQDARPAAGTMAQPAHSAADPNAEAAIDRGPPARACRRVFQVAGEPGRAEEPAGRLLDLGGHACRAPRRNPGWVPGPWAGRVSRG